MKLFKFFQKKDYDVSKLNAEDFKNIFTGFMDLHVGTDKVINAVFSCIDAYGLYFSKAKFRVYDESIPNNVKEIKDSKIIRLFTAPNDYQTSSEIFYRIATHFAIFGNSYLYKIRNDNDEVIGYQQLLPNLVKRVRNTNSKNLFDYYEYAETAIPKRNIIDFRYPNPYSDIDGYAIINAIEDDITIMKVQKEYTKLALEKGGYLGLTFTTEQQLSDTTFKKVLKELEQKYTGRDNAFKVALLTNGLKILAPPYSPRDMQFGENRNITREEILSVFKVPKILLGIGESINRATAEASVYAFTSGVIDPLLSMIDKVLTKAFKEDFGIQYSVEHDLLTPKDVEGQLKYYSQGLKEGWLTINEVREAEGLNKLTGELSDVPTINVGGALINVDTAKQIDKAN